MTDDEQRQRRSGERAARASVRLFSTLAEENAFLKKAAAFFAKEQR